MITRVSFFLILVFYTFFTLGQTVKTVGTTGADYISLKEAFDAVNSGLVTGSITLKIIDNIYETTTAVLNASGTNQAQYTSVLIYPVAGGLSITGTMNAPLIRLNGADNITIDGRVNLAGDVNLTVSNPSIETLASTIQFIGGASFNTLRYCLIKGATRNSTGGVVHFSTSTTTGNLSNLVEYCKVTKDDSGNPVYLIYSYGTALKENSGFIRNNLLSDFCSTSGTSYAVLISSGNTSWEVSYNSIFQTSPIPAALFTIGGIFFAGGAGHSIHDNIIGGGSPEAGDPAWTTTGSGPIRFVGLSMNVFSSSVSQVYNNIIRNINFTSSSAAISASGLWTGYYLLGGLINFGNLGGNIIGRESGTGNISITTTSSANVAGSYGILTGSSGSGTIQICNNKIGSVTVNNIYSHSGSGHRFYCIFAQIGSPTITNNYIGSAETPRSIQTINSQSTGTSTGSQDVNGIVVTYSGGNPVFISGNHVENLYNGWKVASSQYGLVRGIQVSAGTGTLTITNNVIKGLQSEVPNTGAGNLTCLSGIVVSSSPATLILSGNQIERLEHLSAASPAVQVAGVLITGGAGNGQLKSNKVTDLTCNTQAPGGGVLSGIYLAGGNHQVENNLVRIFNQTSGNPTTIRGIWDAAGPSYTINYYFNSVRIGGSQTTGTNADSYAFYRSAATSNILKNNNFTNFRESLPGSGKSYGIALPEVSGNIVLDYNNYFAGSAAGIMALYGAVEISSLPVINGQDVSSISDDPLFASENNMHPTGYHLNNKGIFVPGITTDQEGSVRTDPPDIGALEFSLFADLTTMEPADITISTATLKGMVNPKNETATGAFEYGTTISYGNSVAWLPASVSGAGGMLAEAQVGSLVPNTLYHFRINAATPAGTSYGPDQTFRTIPSSQSTFICTGAGLWSDGANWDMGVPGDVTDAIIPAGKEVTTDGQVVCDDLTINAGGAVTVGMGNRLQVKGNLLVDSDETGAGSLIAASEDVEVTGSATIRCFITGASESWHFLSSPVVDQQIAGEFTPSGSYPDGTGYDFYLWQESTGVWMNRKAPTWITANGHDQFQTGRGYLVAYEALNPVRQFSGALVSGQIEIPLTNTGSTSYRCFNLAGNPYCSSIDWKSPTGIDKTSLFNEPGGGCVIYIYNGAAGNYGVYHDQAVGDEGTNGVGRYIPPMQGFFVRAKADIQPCTMLINNEARVHEKPSWLKSQDVSRLGISVTDISSGLKDEVLFEFGHSITGGGAEKWFSLANRAPSLYHVKDGKKYSLVFLTSAGMSPELELSFKAGCAGNYRFTWAIVNLPGITWFLEDLQSGLVMDLSTQDEYCFYGSPGDQDGRFRLKQVPSSVEPSSTRKDFSIYYVSHGFIIMVHDSTVGQNEGKLNISDQSGRVVGTFGIEGGNPYRVDVILPPGIYIARLTMGNRSVISKVIVF